MKNLICTSCQKPKANLHCGICNCDICKYCAQILDEDSFSFLEKKPKNLTYQIYCSTCYDKNVVNELEKYNLLIEQAKEILVFMKAQAKETRLIKRDADPIKIENCNDKEELIMRMAFQAVQNDFNAIIDVEIVSKKIRLGSYQTTVFSGTAIPADVIDKKLIKDRSFKSQPN